MHVTVTIMRSFWLHLVPPPTSCVPAQFLSPSHQFSPISFHSHRLAFLRRIGPFQSDILSHNPSLSLSLSLQCLSSALSRNPSRDFSRNPSRTLSRQCLSRAINSLTIPLARALSLNPSSSLSRALTQSLSVTILLVRAQTLVCVVSLSSSCSCFCLARHAVSSCVRALQRLNSVVGSVRGPSRSLSPVSLAHNKSRSQSLSLARSL